MKNGICRPFLEGTTSLVDKLITRLEKSSHKGLLFDKLRARSRGLMGRRRSICGGAPETAKGDFKMQKNTAERPVVRKPRSPITRVWIPEGVRKSFNGTRGDAGKGAV